MEMKVCISGRLFFLYLFSCLVCSYGGSFGVRTPLQQQIFHSSPKLSPRLFNTNQLGLQIRGGDNIKSESTNKSETMSGDKEDCLLVEAQVETKQNQTSATEKEVTVQVEEEEESDLGTDDEMAEEAKLDEPSTEKVPIERVGVAEEEKSDLDTDDEMAEEIDVDSDFEEDYYTDSEEEDSDFVVDEHGGDDEEEIGEDQSLEMVVATMKIVSQRTGILAWKVSKVAAKWAWQWSYDVYRACERAVDAGRAELAQGDYYGKVNAEMDKAATTRLEKIHRKTLMLGKYTFRILSKMTVAFWTLDDDDILDFNIDTIKPKFSFLDKLKLRTDYEVDEDIIDETDAADAAKTSRRRRKRKCKSKSCNTGSSKKDKESNEEKTVVTVVPKIKRSKRLILSSVAIGVASRLLWEHVGTKALLMKGISLLPQKLKRSDTKAEILKTDEK